MSASVGEEEKRVQRERKMVAKHQYMADATVSFIFMVACIVPFSLADSILKPLNMSEVLLLSL